MSVIDKIEALGAKLPQIKSALTTEEAAKLSLINPLLRALGYDTTNPKIVAPEHHASFNAKKDARVDYAVFQNEADYPDKPCMIIEAKVLGAALDANAAGQLRMYFAAVQEAPIAVLTDGNRYQFFANLDSPKNMDKVPFMELVLEHPDPDVLKEISNYARDTWNANVVLDHALRFKHLRAIRKYFEQQLGGNMTDEFEKAVLKATCHDIKAVTSSVLTMMRPLIQTVIDQYIFERAGKAQPAAVVTLTPASKPVQVKIARPMNALEQQGHDMVQAMIDGACDPSKIRVSTADLYTRIAYCKDGEKQGTQFFRMYFQKSHLLKIRTYENGDNTLDIPISSLDAIQGFKDAILKGLQRAMS